MNLRFKFLTTGIPTGNGRLYTKTAVEPAVNALAKKLESAPAYGGAKHEKEFELDKVSHLIRKVYIEGNDVWADISLLPTTAGKNLAEILKAGGSIGVSARGFGQTKKNSKGQDEVYDYQLAGVDFCLNPATSNFVSSKNLFESAPLTEEKVDIMEARYRAACVAGYRGTIEQYRVIYLEYLEREKAEDAKKLNESIGAAHQAAIDRAKKNPKAADGFPASYPGDPTIDGDEDDEGLTEDEYLVIEVALANAISQTMPNCVLHEWNADVVVWFDMNKSEFFESSYNITDEGKVEILERRRVDNV